MAKFRTNYSRDKNPFFGLWVRVILMILVILVIFFIAYRMLNSSTEAGFEISSYERDYLVPNDPSVEVIHHRYYSLGYSEKHEQASWVCYVLNRDELRIPNVQRSKRFYDDPTVKNGSATYYDYSGSGYSRGHLAPAGDMAFNDDAMRESFYMSNMSPQQRAFNGGIWRELEENVRDWAYSKQRLYIITGPILTEISGYIGEDNRVAIPQYFFKAIIDLEGKEKEGIGFIIPNQKTDVPLREFAVSIDEVESKINIDLFDALIEDDNMEEQIESSIDLKAWPISIKRYQLRVSSWNNS